MQQGLHRVPSIFLLNLKRPGFQAHRHTKPPAEVVRHSPRVPADPASPILHRTGMNNSMLLPQSLNRRSPDCVIPET